MIFTWGNGQDCKCGRSMQHCFADYGGPDFFEARQKFIALYGVGFCSSYDTEDQAGVERYQLQRIVLNDSDPTRCVCGRGPAPDYRLAHAECLECNARVGSFVLRGVPDDYVPPPLLCRDCKEWNFRREVETL